MIVGRSASGVRSEGRVTSRARPTSCASKLLVERLRRLLGGLDRLQCARDVRAERVVLRLVDLPARREQHDERDADRHGGREGGADREAQPRPRAGPDGEGDEQPGDGRGRQHDPDQRAQVRGDRVAGLDAYLRDVEAGALGDARDGVAVDRPQVDVQAHGQPDRPLEPHSPVDQRHVEVERAPMAGLGGDRDTADRELLRLGVRVQREVRAGERGGDDGDDDERVARRVQEELAAPAPVAAA